MKLPPGVRLTECASLRGRNTFGVQATAPLLVEVEQATALPAAFALQALRTGPLLVLGGGSNLLFAGDPEGPVLVPGGRDIRILRESDGVAVVRADAGVDWHALVLWTLRQGLCGLENLALIPGRVGAAPIQNIGAYGVEVAEHIHAVEAFERNTWTIQRLDPAACAFGYRDSVFKRDSERFIVTAVEFALSGHAALRLDYSGLRDELGAVAHGAITATDVAQAVMRIRRRKLPDPALIGNAGSFFKNPIVPMQQAQDLSAAEPDLPMFGGSGDGSRKLSAAWLIDACGWKGHRDADAGVSAQHALVLVNHGEATGAEILALAGRIAVSVRERFGVGLEPEPRIIGAYW